LKELLTEAKIENLDEVLTFVEEEIESSACPPKLVTQIAIAVEEIFVNIANYAYNPEVGGAKIRIIADDTVVIEFEDAGRPYNPLEKADPNIHAGIEERQIGGLGIFMVKNIMDTVDYRYESGKNILTIKKTW